ncbi:piezo-type mechanosensitive ion channel component isoform X1 [Diorhabda carinulata]|uniref:piezo-type mechanosensitive ion channel component isoform X1 n=1 Tax=Diorhabda carinulata TaxID=1163345 RepID=UPI0025A11CD5|nr:piezo-type mechanosensitive ion channel component isoform X1 [Diorhabda carinulata]
MVRYIANIFLFRLLLPIIITLCILFRPTLFSSIYLIFMLLIPFVSLPSTDSMKGTTGIFIKVLLGVSTSLTLIQAAFQIALVIVKPYGQFLDENPKLEEILFYIGLAKLNGLTGTYILIWIGPEIGMFLTSLVLLFALKKLNPIEEVILESQAGVVDVTIRVPQSTDYAQYLIAVGRYATLILLCLAGVVRPSIEGGVYYSIFLGVATWWACYKQLKRGFAILLRCIIPLVILHMSALYAVNFKIIQKYLPEDGGCARYFDLAPFVTTIDSSTVGNATNSSTNSTLIMDERSFYYYFNRDITFYIYPVILYLLFYLLVLESKELMKPEPKKKMIGSFSATDGMSRKVSARLSKQKLLTPTAAQKWQKASRKVRMALNKELAEPTESTPLLRGPTRRSKRVPGRLIQDSTGSVTVTNENEDIPLDVFAADCVSEEEEEEYDLTLFHHIIFALETIIQYVVRSSYIATNIIMMAWSITYLSWITFVLLLWANIIWLIPNQRKRMLSSSPFLVVYALFLLISAYVYSMRLNEDELPSKAEGVDLGEIGFKKPEGLPCIPLLVKSLYTVMFWITLRQYMHEKMEEKQTSALADMVAPLQVTVGTATGVKKESETDGSKFMTKFGQLINKFLIKFWIWVVAITLFAVAITGERMTVFRILYMTLFLFFILSFQFSFRVWRKVMFGFWLTVIVYSMIILVLVYTYQFKRFPDYWAWYLHIQKDQQHDIGLEQYKTKQLFVRLVTPTFFVIVTVIQLHYFHHDFMQLTDPKRTSTPQAETQPQENESINDSSVQGGAYMDRSRESTSKYYSEQDLAIVPAVLMTKWFEKALQLFFYTKHIIFLFLEIHMLKIVLFFTMLMCIYDKCAIYFVIVVLATISFTCGRNVQMFTAYFTSVFVSVLILGRMIYQISYINDKKWNVSCRVKKNPNLNETIVNNGPWLGFGKLSEIDQNLPGLVLWNIMFIVVMCLWKVIEVRQFNYRLSRGRSTEKRFFMFPRITRDDADKDLVHFAKYMANYGFYKFGVEISFIFIATLIAVRMDLYALMHCIWLLIMFSLPRNTLSRIWVVYLIFIAISIPFQYFQAVGLPPSLCIEFPWDAADPVLRSLQSWAFLLDNYTPPPVEKLVFDFMLLMAVSRQWVVFRIERRYAGQNYAGGSNESIISQAEQKDFVNPVPDYITFVRSYLDILKKAVLQSFLWITLAVVFWAGTSRVNVFSLGYLLCAFVFLWHGSDFYLRPIPKILRYWQFLLGYNVMVIFIKCSLQILGCIYPHYIPSVCCWLIQMFAITCVRNFVGTASRALPPTSSDDGQDCAISEGGISWDVICFTLLILQKRIFNSYNFFHIIDDTKATAILASRGAELMEEMRQQTMKEQEETEKKVLEKIREKMERIKANQQKIQGDRMLTTNHYVDSVSHGRPKYAIKPPVTYKQAIRSGDYYMFDEVEDDEIDILPEEKESFDEFDVGLKPYLGELLSDVVKEDINKALRNRSQTMLETRENIRLRRQTSMPAARRTTRPQLTTTFSAPPTIAENEPKSVRIQDEPLPSTSQERDDDISSLTEPQVTIGQKIFQIFYLLWAFIDGIMVTLTKFLNKYSRNYRIILKVLAKEKRVLKERTNYNIGVRMGKDQIWQPAGSYHSLLRNSRQDSIHGDSDDDKPPLSEDSDTKALAPSLPCSPEPDRRKASVLTVPEIRILAASLERGLDSPCPSSRKSEEDAQMSPYVDYGDEMSSVDQPTIVRLLLASWYLIMSRSEIVCYFVIFLNQLRNSNLISLPLPLMVFFWGSLTIPRPSKTFWVTIIAYTEVVVLLKVVFQFHVMPGNRMRQQTEFLTSASERNPFYPPTLIGLHKNKDIEAFWDLLLLLVVFFHRVLLKSMGIWSSTTPVTAALIDDGEYKVMGEKLIPVRHQDDDDDTDDSQPSTSTPKTHSSKKKSITDQDDADVVVIRTMKLKKLNNAVMAVRLGIYKYAEEFKLFIQQLLDPASRVTADVYSFMFLCDFINFFVILFGFSAFGTQEDGSVSDYLQDNRVPPLFLFMLIFQFMLIIIDRGIYLRKNILAKIIFQFVQIILLHIWLFILFPVVTKTSCNTLIPPQIYYIAKCSYLLLSAYQIRCGYPTRILGNFLCKGYGYVNMFLFKGFMLIPFLFELRTCMDWMWTETSMAIFDWIKLEDIFQHIFLLKCSRNVEDEYPQPRAQEKNRTVKYLMGGALLTVIIGIIWFPLVFFSLGDAVGNPNPPSDVSLEIRIGPYEPIYQMTVQSNSIFQFTPQELEDIKALYNAYQVSENFIFNYEAADITAIRLNTDSSNIWSISPPDRKRMIKEVNSTKLLKIRLEYKITHRTSKAEDSGLVTFSKEITMEPSTNTSINEDRENLLKYLDGKEAEPVRFTYILPKFVKVTNRGTVDPISVLLLDKPDVEATTFRNVTIKLLRENTSGYEQAWWKVNEICNDYNYEHILMKVPYHDCKDSILLYAFNDKVFPPTLDIITSGGIIGLYTTLVLVASRILRGFFADGMSKIMFEDLPNVDRVLRLCLDIYLVREVHEFALEEDLFAKLVFLFRSPETLIKWSRPKEEVADEDDPEGDGE